MTKHEIDRRIERIVGEVAALAPEGACAESPFRPRWIRPSELVRRMRPFVVLN